MNCSFPTISKNSRGEKAPNTFSNTTIILIAKSGKRITLKKITRQYP